MIYKLNTDSQILDFIYLDKEYKKPSLFVESEDIFIKMKNDIEDIDQFIKQHEQDLYEISLEEEE